MFRTVGWLLVLALASAGALPTAAASGYGDGDAGTLAPCDAAEPVCEALQGCEATNLGKLTGDPVGVLLGCL